MERVCFRLLFLLTLFVGQVGCGPVPPPKNAYTDGQTLLEDMAKRRDRIRSFRITGRVDHFGDGQRIQGKIFLFAKLPESLRIELVSPFDSPLQILTVNEGVFALHDLREGRFFTGPAEPCNIARLVRIPLPPEDVARILIGHSPIIEGETRVTWDRRGYYRVDIEAEGKVQQLQISGDKNRLELQRSRLALSDGTVVFDLIYKDWDPRGDGTMPHQIRVKMPRDKADLLLRYDADGVEINVTLPRDAWTQAPPRGIKEERLSCDSP